MALWRASLDRPELHTEQTQAEKRVYDLLALVIILAFGVTVSAFLVPAHGGVDQNGYLYGGRVLLEHGAAGLQTHDPYQFVGRMWVGFDLGGDAERYYPKYPIGLPVLFGLAQWIGGAHLAYWINPIAMTLGLVAVYGLVRMVAGSAIALIATAVTMTSPATVLLATNPNSHATALACSAGGMAVLLAWSRRVGGPPSDDPSPGARRAWALALIGGLLCGCAVTIRYTEGLLLLPIALIVLLSMRWRDWRGYAQAAVIALGWALPVGGLLAYNHAAFGSLTGYDPTNESVGFSLEYFRANWTTMLDNLHGSGLVLFFPLALAGLIVLLWQHWRLGLIMLAWAVPGVLAYTAYYWAPDGTHIGYLRFFLTLLPPLAVAFSALLAHLFTMPAPEGRRSHRGAWQLAAGALALLTIGMNLSSAVPQLALDQVRRYALLERANAIAAVAPPDAVIFSNDQHLLHHIQFTHGYRCYTLDLFDRRSLQRFASARMDEPQGLQPQRRAALAERAEGMSQKELSAERVGVIRDALEEGRAVFVVERLWYPRRSRTPGFALAGSLPDDLYDVRIVASFGRPVVGDFTPTSRRTWGSRVRRRPPQLSTRLGNDRGFVRQVQLIDAPADQDAAAAAPPETARSGGG